jgi:hypothetical protein
VTVTPPGNPLCTNVAGDWNFSESGSAHYSIVAPIESDDFTDPVGGSGIVTITQTGCSFQYIPVPTAGLIGTNVTADQLASFIRTGTVSGNDVTVTGKLALVNTVAQPGLTITNITSNVMNASGQVTGGVVTLNATGTFDASGTYALGGQTGSFTLTITASSTATLTSLAANRPVGGAPTRATWDVRVSPDQARSGRQLEMLQEVRAALSKALVLGLSVQW